MQLGEELKNIKDFLSDGKVTSFVALFILAGGYFYYRYDSNVSKQELYYLSQIEDCKQEKLLKDKEAKIRDSIMTESFKLLGKYEAYYEISNHGKKK